MSDLQTMSDKELLDVCISCHLTRRTTYHQCDKYEAEILSRLADGETWKEKLISFMIGLEVEGVIDFLEKADSNDDFKNLGKLIATTTKSKLAEAKRNKS